MQNRQHPTGPLQGSDILDGMSKNMIISALIQYRPGHMHEDGKVVVNDINASDFQPGLDYSQFTSCQRWNKWRRWWRRWRKDSWRGNQCELRITDSATHASETTLPSLPSTRNAFNILNTSKDENVFQALQIIHFQQFRKMNWRNRIILGISEETYEQKEVFIEEIRAEKNEKNKITSTDIPSGDDIQTKQTPHDYKPYNMNNIIISKRAIGSQDTGNNEYYSESSSIWNIFTCNTDSKG